jgi:putative ABC transport system substrate-binding protein
MPSRRTFLSAALLLAAGRPAAQDKAARIHRIGFLDPVSLQANAANMEQFRKGLRDLGYAEGKNLTAKNASAGRIPVVTATVVDPVETKVVDSLERPGGNVTGVAVDTADLEAKRLQLLRALAPGASRVAVIMDMANPALGEAWKALQPAAKALNVELELFDVRKPEEMAAALQGAAARKAGAALLRAGTLAPAVQVAVVEAAAKHRLPVLYGSRQFVDAGGLASYGVNTPQMYYRAAAFVDKILKGARPADLPMERPTRFELVFNRLAAHRLGLIIPPDLLLKSDQVVG